MEQNFNPGLMLIGLSGIEPSFQYAKMSNSLNNCQKNNMLSSFNTYFAYN